MSDFKRRDYRCFHRSRVRWVEVDLQKVVFNGHYLQYMDNAMTEYWRALAVPYDTGMQTLGGEMFVKKVTLEYHASARFGDLLDVGIRCLRVGNSSCTFESVIFCGSQLLTSGELIYVFADPVSQTSRPVPAALRAMFTGYEAGEPVTHIKVGSWAELGALAGPLRTEVFVEEQGVSAEIEADALDADAVHVVALNGLGMPVATGRLLLGDGSEDTKQKAAASPEQRIGRIGRMAVSRHLRGGALGRQVLDALVAASEARGDRKVELHAQCTAENFYRRAGFQVVGEVYEEAGIEHITMERAFA